MEFFFYGIFLDRDTRLEFGIDDEPHYDTVRDYVTYGNRIVEAVHAPDRGLSLTGLRVFVPVGAIPRLDELEAGYARKTVKTTGGKQVQMYVAPQ